MGIFADTAPAYWAAGLPVIPLKQNDKMPVIDGWSQFAHKMPNVAEQDHWLARYGNGNIGMVLGAQSGLFFLDIDTDEERLKDAIFEALKPNVSPWVRIGQRGMVLAYKQPLSGIIPTFHISRTGADKGALVDGISTRGQAVLPPSIHPKTMQPYVANCALLDVLGELPYIPSDIEAMLRQVMQENGVKLNSSGWTKVTDFVAPGARDNEMTRMSGLFAQGVTRGELTLMEAIGRLRVWGDNLVQKVAGDDVDIDKGIQNLVGFLIRDVMERKKVLPVGWDEGMDEAQKLAMGVNFTHEHEQWTYEQIMKYLQVELEKHGPSSVGWTVTIDAVLDRMARSSDMSSVAEGMIFGYICEISPRGVTMAKLERKLREIRTGEITGTNHNEIAVAVAKLMSEHGEIRHHNGKFWQWRGAHWAHLLDQDIQRVVSINFGSLSAARKQGDHTGIVKVMAINLSMALKRSDQAGVNFANGYLTEDLVLLPHDPDYGCICTLPFRYLPEEVNNARKWDAFLDRVWSDPVEGPDPDITEKKAALQEAMAATLFGKGVNYQQAFLLYGAAATGKSQLLRVIEELVPPEGRSAIPPNDWSDKFRPSEMAGKLLNIAGELSNTKFIDGQRFKTFITGETATVEAKFGRPFSFQPTAAQWFGSNYLPQSKDTSAGFSRRWLFFEFNHPIPNSERVVDLGNLLVAEEREQIVAWVVSAMPRLIAQKTYTKSTSHQALEGEMKNQNNEVRRFITEGGVVNVIPGEVKVINRINRRELYQEYQNYCFSIAMRRPLSEEIFNMLLLNAAIDLGIHKVKNLMEGNKPTDIYYTNLALVTKRPIS